MEGLGVQRVLVEENVAFVGYDGGTVALAVRNRMWVGHVREVLKDVDFTTRFRGFRNLQVGVDGDAGRTGRELRDAWDASRRDAAREAAGKSEALRRILKAFGGAIESIEPSRGATPPSFLENPDD